MLEKDHTRDETEDALRCNAGTLAPPTSSIPPKALPPPPDGGLLAWSQVLAGHLVAFNSWGYVNSFGLFQAYYTATLSQSPSTISWVGGIQIFLMMFIGAFSGRALDAGYYYYVVVPGLALQVLGVFMTSLATKYWQLLITQGICQGIGSGLAFTPTMALVSTYFTTKRSLAVCGMSSGTATGGVVFPIIARQLLDRVGIGWTIRTMGFVFLANAAIALALIRPRPMGRKKGPLVEFMSFLDPWYSLFSLGMLLVVLGLYFVYYYVSCPAASRLSLPFHLICRSDYFFRPGYSSYILLYVSRSSTRHECPWIARPVDTCLDRRPLARSPNHATYCRYIDWHTNLHMGGYRFVAGPLGFHYCLWLHRGQHSKYGSSCAGKLWT